MPDGAANISENSRRIARNTVFLYFRMLLLMFIGLFTARIILRNLGFDDYGLYNAVGSIVAISNVVAMSVSAAIGRFITAGLGEGDAANSRRIFAVSQAVSICLCVVVLLLVETVGLWFLNTQMDIPAGREDAANWVYQCSAGVLVLALLSVPYNASILAHEKMSAFAYVSIVEAVLKLAVAIAILYSPVDKLKLYALLLLGVAFFVRLSYGLYCRRHFAETVTRPVFDRTMLKRLLGFAGWNFLGSGTFLLNTQGTTILTNIFYGVGMNAPRGVAGQIENIVKQFVNNVVIAINPQITKSYVSGNRDYSFELACKGSRYAVLIILLFLVPYIFEADRISLLLFGKNPEGTGVFSTLAIVCVMMDLILTTFATLELAYGDIKRYYIIISSVSILILPITWAAFALGAPAWSAYIVFIAVYLVADALKLLIIRSQTGFPIRKFAAEVLAPCGVVAAVSIGVTGLCRCALAEGWWRMVLVLGVSALATAICSWFVALTDGERSFIKSKVCRKSA